MRARLAWGGMILIIALASQPARAAEPTSLRISPVESEPAERPVMLPGMDVPGGRVGLGFYQTSPKRSFHASVKDAIEPPRYRKAPGVGLKLSF